MADAEQRCPFLVPVMADRLWMYPMPAYCRRPDAQVKVPASSTILRICASPAYVRCPGYVMSAAKTDRGKPRRLENQSKDTDLNPMHRRRMALVRREIA